MNSTISAPKSRHSWAFLVNTRRGTVIRRRPRSGAPSRNLYHYVVVACSKEAKAFGVRAGMRYDEARKLVPNLRVLVCNG